MLMMKLNKKLEAAQENVDYDKREHQIQLEMKHEKEKLS